MVGQGGIGNVQLLLNLADYQTVRMSREKKLDDPQPWFGAHCGEHVGKFRYLLWIGFTSGLAHISTFAEIRKFVKPNPQERESLATGSRICLQRLCQIAENAR